MVSPSLSVFLNNSNILFSSFELGFENFYILFIIYYLLKKNRYLFLLEIVNIHKNIYPFKWLNIMWLKIVILLFSSTVL